jgi:hypothetical protein
MIQRCTCDGYIDNSILVAPKSKAVWKPRAAWEVTQILSWGTEPSTIVQAEEQRPSMITFRPELRRP